MEASEKADPSVGPKPGPQLRGLRGDVEIAAILASDRGIRGAARLELMLNTVLDRLTAVNPADEKAPS